MPNNLSEKKVHKTGRIDQVVRDYFEKNKSISEILAKDLMPLFIEKGIFLKDQKKGLPIRQLLRDLDAAGKLSMLKLVQVVRKDAIRNWYFAKN
ncbi:MAG TPA: hypothetical protein VK588_06270 [Chitinophagaceae bacterium]|nr:hypothetical protein [Chitinophagaceae bacterium]